MQKNAVQELQNPSLPVVPQTNVILSEQSFEQFQSVQAQQQQNVVQPVVDQEDDDMMHAHMMDDEGDKDVIIPSDQPVVQNLVH